MNFTEKLISVAKRSDLTRGLVSEEKAKTFEALFHHMVEVNEHLNLTAITDEDGVILRHFVDSLALVPLIPEEARVCDVGCGGGFPTLPLAISRDDVSVLGLDSVTKKVNYVKETADLLGLSNVSTSNVRAEVLGQDKSTRETFDIACARGVGRLNLICELCLPLVRVGGRFIAMKSVSAPEEIEEARKAITLLGGKLERVIDYTLSDGNETLSRTIIIIQKTTHTPPKYPRNNSQISKKPL
jgi:16S rRNA (guanine527-N7)-methyltransferase